MQRLRLGRLLELYRAEVRVVWLRESWSSLAGSLNTASILCSFAPTAEAPRNTFVARRLTGEEGRRCQRLDEPERRHLTEVRRGNR